MKKVLSVVLSLVLMLSVCMTGIITAQAFEVSVPAATQTIGSGIPPANLIYKYGDYEFEIQNYNGNFEVTYPDNTGGVQVVTTADGNTAARESWVFVRYPIDANTGTYTFNLNLRRYADTTTAAENMAVKFHLYDKTGNRYIRGANLMSNLTWNTTEAVASNKFNNLTFSVNTNTGYYSGKVDEVTLKELGDNVLKLDDLSGGIGMIGLQIITAKPDWGYGVGITSASVTHDTKGVLGSGILTKSVYPTIEDGDFEATLVHYGYPDRVSYADGKATIMNGPIDSGWTAGVQIKNNKSHNSANTGTLSFEFGVNAVGDKFNDGSFITVYSKSDSDTPVLTFGTLLYEGDWLLGDNTTSSIEPITLKLNIDMETGEWTLYGGDRKFTGGSGTIDVSNGIGMVNLELKTNAGENGFSVNSLRLTETPKASSYTTDHITHIDNIVPTVGNTYGSVQIDSNETKNVTAENGLLVMSNDSKLAFRPGLSMEYDKKVYIEATVSVDKPLTNAGTVQFTAMEPTNWSYPIDGAQSQFYWSDFSVANKEYVIGFVADMKNCTYSLVQNGEVLAEKGGSFESDKKNFRWIWLNFSDNTGAKLTIHNVKYMEIEPSNYDAATNTYFDSASVLLNGIAHYAGVTSWSENGVSFSAEKSGTVAMTKLDDCGGIHFSGSGSDSDYARLNLTYAFDATNFADTYASVRWNINLAGSDTQQINVASRTDDGEFPVIVRKTVAAGNHTVEFEYNPSSREYICLFDGVKVGKYQIAAASLPNVFLEWYSADAADVMTLKNVSVRKLTDNGEDIVGDIMLSQDNKTANAVVTIGKKFSPIAGEVSFFIAAYEGSELKAVNVANAIIDTGVNNLETALGDLNGASVVKAFLWETATNTPLK